jgi:Cu(I)/Ag(I) efflux system membrane fusion protein
MKKILGLVAIMTIATTAFTYAQSKTDIALNQALTAYYDLKNALAMDKKDLAIEKAKVLSTKVNAVNHKDLPAEQHKIFMEQAAIIKSKSAQLAGSNDIKTQRKAFEGISYAMIKTLKDLKFNSQTVYIQHCPMAKASWLNEKENIENPYYGSMMFDCGDISETIKSK